MMLKTALTAAAVCLFALPLAAQEVQDVTMTGAVVDVSCYSTMGASGPSHKACAQTCAHAGSPLAIMVNGVIYMPVSPKPNNPQNGRLVDFAEGKVKVTGTVRDVSGLHTIVIKSIDAAT
ncbi:MAG TPA: hypothetical protein VNX15_12520 [Gemmatimonadales bacterium]|jgi:hypothetical protein|nr:hypothetical protein [Gemmatimonadales bacterium]